LAQLGKRKQGRKWQKRKLKDGTGRKELRRLGVQTVKNSFHRVKKPQKTRGNRGSSLMRSGERQKKERDRGVVKTKCRQWTRKGTNRGTGKRKRWREARKEWGGGGEESGSREKSNWKGTKKRTET